MNFILNQNFINFVPHLTNEVLKTEFRIGTKAAIHTLMTYLGQPD